MRWATRAHLHLDRVATCWLIRRFIDPAAEFAFVDVAAGEMAPPGAITFALPGADISAHDAGGTTFLRAMRRFQLDDEALVRLADIVQQGVHIALAPPGSATGPIDDVVGAVAHGLVAASEGMVVDGWSDEEIVARGSAIYDSLYAWCRGQTVTAANPAIADLSLRERMDMLRAAVGVMSEPVGRDGG